MKTNLQELKDRINRNLVTQGGPLQTDCLVWCGSVTKQGYAQTSVHPTLQNMFGGKIVRVHRVVYQLANRDFNPNLLVLHKCDNRACCNIDHLKQGTNRDNVADKMKRNRHRARSGETHPRAKLNWKQVEEIRETQNKTQSELADKYGVSISTVNSIKRGQTWTI